jgi:hypothetical protein
MSVPFAVSAAADKWQDIRGSFRSDMSHSPVEHGNIRVVENVQSTTHIVDITILDFFIIAVPIAILFAALIFSSRKPASPDDAHNLRDRGSG